MCLSGYNQRNRPVGDIQKDLLQGIGLCDCGGRLGKSEIRKAGLEEGQARSSRAWPELLSAGGVSSS